ncbi:unnamed protein product [Prorocentrum cordatum]|uniref:Phospholipase B-like n=1 Tax=Prorocentrum cordatum TaxID=2364126 RepID=A0ABN9TPM4_9DINO|nr:unnamed protein product [Polarella glacialis]
MPRGVHTNGPATDRAAIALGAQGVDSCAGRAVAILHRLTLELEAPQRCWMEDFRTYAIHRYGKFPVFQAEFNSVAEHFSYRSLSDTSLAGKAFWMRDGVIKASYVSFWLDVDKRSADADFSLELKRRWDEHLDRYNEEASRVAKDAFHTSNLWVMAEAQKELVSGTLNTLVTSGEGELSPEGFRDTGVMH